MLAVAGLYLLAARLTAPYVSSDERESGGSVAAAFVAVILLVQVAAIVIGHIGGVVAAHDRAIELLPQSRLTAGQYPMLTTMVGFTSLGVALLAGS